MQREITQLLEIYKGDPVKLLIDLAAESIMKEDLIMAKAAQICAEVILRVLPDISNEKTTVHVSTFNLINDN